MIYKRSATLRKYISVWWIIFRPLWSFSQWHYSCTELPPVTMWIEHSFFLPEDIQVLFCLLVAGFSLLFVLLFIFIQASIFALFQPTFRSTKSKWFSKWLWFLNIGRQNILPSQLSWNKINLDIFIQKKCGQEETEYSARARLKIKV